MVTNTQFIDHSNLANQEFANRQILLKGTGVPNLPASLYAFYRNDTNQDLYEKTGPNNADWTLFKAGSTPVTTDPYNLIKERNCNATLAVGDLVLTSTIAFTVDKVLNSLDSRPVIGIVVEKTSTITARILYHGDYTFTGLNLSIGQPIFTSQAGGITQVSLPGWSQMIGNAVDVNTIHFSPYYQRYLKR